MRKNMFIVLSLLIALSMVLAACAPQTVEVIKTVEVEKEVTVVETVEVEKTVEVEVVKEVAAAAEKTQIRWFVGLGTGTDPNQVEVQQAVVDAFNASQEEIELVLEVVPYDAARDTLSTQIAAGAGPDIVGPVGWGGSNDFYGQWLDLTTWINQTGFDTSIFDPNLVKFYQTEEGQVGLPFAVFPGALYFNPAMFDEVGLAYPPQVYGEKYVLDGAEVDWTWEVLTEVAKRLTLDINGLNSTEAGFDRTQITQVGYSPQWQSILSVATFYGAAKIWDGSEGNYVSTIPASWEAAFRWYYDGMWGEQPYMATGPLAAAPEFGNGNVFNSGKAAMGLTQTWYTCCLGDYRDAGNEFQLGIQPMSGDGVVHGRIDADTFRIWKGTQNPKEAFTVLAYLITTGADTLLPVYGAMPAVPSKTEAFFEAKSKDYPFVTPESWNVFVQGLAYPDTPSSEQYQPNSIEANARFATFADLMNNTAPDAFDFDTEFQKLVDDLTVIYNKK